MRLALEQTVAAQQCQTHGSRPLSPSLDTRIDVALIDEISPSPFASPLTESGPRPHQTTGRVRQRPGPLALRAMGARSGIEVKPGWLRTRTGTLVISHYLGFTIDSNTAAPRVSKKLTITPSIQKSRAAVQSGQNRGGRSERENKRTRRQAVPSAAATKQEAREGRKEGRRPSSGPTWRTRGRTG